MGDYDYDFDLEDLYDEGVLPGHPNVWYEDDDFNSMDEYTMERGFWEEIDMCVQPTLRDGFSQVSTLLLWCFIFRLSTQSVAVPTNARHGISACTGIYIMYVFFNWTVVHILAFATVMYIVLLTLSKFYGQRRGPVIGIISIIYLIVSEIFLVPGREWHKIRGAQMIIAMKVISLSFDSDIGTIQTVPSLVDFAGYVFNIGTCVFGPWVSFKDYLAIFNKPLWNIWWVLRICMNLVLAFFFLSISTCWSHWFIPDDTWRWWGAYRDALSFRSSHYFISFLSEASALLVGFGRTADDDWSVHVTKPHMIEIPRSLVQVVVYWNMPMHNWLKTYVFRTTIPYGSFAAVLSTYAASSLLHGLNFQLSAVLLSLGVYTYVEYMLRQKLASIFKACILVRPCRKECPHQHRESRVIVVITNVFLGLLVMFHLAYLGVMFDSSSKEQEVGYSYSHTLAKWSSLNYASHWVVLGTYIFNFLI
ncbi:Protein-serine O-palmitoleoyltransferase porcupine [Frankliniella fusca]|uniref:Protein-serine O-palmitoleoyltransferase porcupine n=1 Tax=Frankliniella fusca TaxID=407009 RepID=A0AAE1H0U3_9NEOP|nr:Protein-serine O-palmitoleoyltransferase porcupine [Frankliniella fusca]